MRDTRASAAYYPHLYCCARSEPEVSAVIRRPMSRHTVDLTVPRTSTGSMTICSAGAKIVSVRVHVRVQVPVETGPRARFCRSGRRAASGASLARRSVGSHRGESPFWPRPLRVLCSSAPGNRVYYVCRAYEYATAISTGVQGERGERAYKAPHPGTHAPTATVGHTRSHAKRTSFWTARPLNGIARAVHVPAQSGCPALSLSP